MNARRAPGRRLRRARYVDLGQLQPNAVYPTRLHGRVSPAWGGDAMSGADALWGRESMAGIGHDPLMSSGGQRLDTEVGYGLPIGNRFVGTPRAGVRTSEYGRDYRIGYGMQSTRAGQAEPATRHRRRTTGEPDLPDAGAGGRRRPARPRARHRASGSGTGQSARSHHCPTQDRVPAGRKRGRSPVQRPTHQERAGHRNNANVRRLTTGSETGEWDCGPSCR